MRTYKALLASVLLLGFGAVYAAEKLSPAEFVDEASAKSVAEIEGGKMALRKSSSEDVKAYAQRMIDHHTTVNTELAKIAHQKNLKVANEAELMSKAQELILKLREGESFDKAYAKNQVSAHEATIKLFREESHSSADPELKSFATKSLPMLEQHLEEAKRLAEAH